jgi:predicted DNA-binding transcriptional regulator YafY
LSVLLLLQSRRRLTAGELATELDVSRRTIYRDIVALQAAGVPVYGHGGVDGGYRLVDGYRTRLTGLTDCEAEALLIMPPAGPTADLGFGEFATAARLKIAAALPPGVGERASRVGSRFLLDAAAWAPDAPGTALLPAVAQAVKEEFALEVVSRDGRAARTLMPYGIVLEAGRWYVVAAENGSLAVQSLAGLHTVSRSSMPFVAAEDFDLRRFWGARLG